MATAATLSDATIVGAARTLRRLCLAIETALGIAIAGSVLAIGAVHPWAYVPLWFVALALGILLLGRGWAIRRLRALLGWTPFAFHPSDLWLALDVQPSYGLTGWTFDLRRPMFPQAHLLLPGVLFLAWTALEFVPLPPTWIPWTVAPPDTLRGCTFLGSALVFHVAAAAALDQREARGRLRRLVSGVGFLIALVGIIQFGAGATRIYGFFEPLEHGIIFGTFANRNHFAGYMLMVIPVSLALLTQVFQGYRARVGDSPNPRKYLVALTSFQGTAFLYAALLTSVAIAALVATSSRGGLVAFVLSFGLAGSAIVGRDRGAPAWAIAVAFFLMAVSWVGIERIAARFHDIPTDAPGRTLVWEDALSRMHGLWLHGAGFNTFASSMSGAIPFALPKGAEPWPQEIEQARLAGRAAGVRVAPGVPGMVWYREAHNDYLQVLVETGLPGLLLALWGAVAVLRSVRRDPWLLMGASGVLLHSAVEFDLQIPAIAVLYVTLAAMRPRQRTTRETP